MTNVTLLPNEMDLINNEEIILTKNTIINKLIEYLGEIQKAQFQRILKYKDQFPPEIFSTHPKISKGENYKGLPWLVLDHPRYFRKNNVLAIRTMFWWGKFFSTTLHLSGIYKMKYAEKIAGNHIILSNNNFFISTGKSEWEHHFENSNYIPVKGLSAEEFESKVSETDFVKISSCLPILPLDKLEISLLGDYETLLSCIA